MFRYLQAVSTMQKLPAPSSKECSPSVQRLHSKLVINSTIIIGTCMRWLKNPCNCQIFFEQMFEASLVEYYKVHILNFVNCKSSFHLQEVQNGIYLLQGLQQAQSVPVLRTTAKLTNLVKMEPGTSNGYFFHCHILYQN